MNRHPKQGRPKLPTHPMPDLKREYEARKPNVPKLEKQNADLGQKLEDFRRRFALIQD